MVKAQLHKGTLVQCKLEPYSNLHKQNPHKNGYYVVNKIATKLLWNDVLHLDTLETYLELEEFPGQIYLIERFKIIN